MGKRWAGQGSNGWYVLPQFISDRERSVVSKFSEGQVVVPNLDRVAKFWGEAGQARIVREYEPDYYEVQFIDPPPEEGFTGSFYFGVSELIAIGGPW
jgi:hypothetical protein